MRSGSSPLARGLRTTRPESPSESRIIPARAGFTFVGMVQISGPRDHPRSRGVYGRRFSAWGPTSGSSPLARGLHADVLLLPRVNRIIPARAGFTWRNKAHIGNMEDHPRSRGVY